MDGKYSVRHYYDEYASHYDKFYQSIQFDKVNHLSEFLQDQQNVLDLGGGSGFVAEWIKASVVNVDLSYNMILEGLKKGREFQGIVGDLELLPIRSNSQEDIISFTAIQNCQEPTRALDEIIRVFSVSGSALITLLRKSSKTPSILNYLESKNMIDQEISIPGEDVCFIFRFPPL